MLYVAAQLAGAICGAALLRLSLPPSYLDTPFVTAGSATAAHPVQVFLLEFTCTFVLTYVVFATVIDKAGAAKVLASSHLPPSQAPIPCYSPRSTSRAVWACLPPARCILSQNLCGFGGTS
jgi:hypothetical protein